MNYAKQIAEILNVRLAEPFRIKDHPEYGTFVLTDSPSDSIIRHFAEPEAYTEEAYKSHFIDDCDALGSLLSGNYEIARIPWKPGYGETYFYASGGTMEYFIHRDTFTGTVEDLSRWRLGNCFKYAEDAQRDIQETHEKLKKEFDEA